MANGKVTLLEYMEPDVMGALSQLKQGVATLDGLLTPTGSGSASPHSMSRVNWPINFVNMLETLVASGVPGVQPFFDKGQVTIAAGTTNYLIGDIPPGSTGSIVYQHTMFVDTYSSEFLMTHQSDNDPPIVVQAPMNSPVILVGAFLRPVRTKITHILTNNDSRDIVFSDLVQAAIMDDTFVDKVFNPIMRENGNVLAALAKGIIISGGGN